MKGRHRGGVLAFGAAGLVFVLFGVMLIVKPVGIMMAGGVGHWGAQRVTSVFGPSQSVGFAVLFLCIGLFLLALARELAKD